MCNSINGHNHDHQHPKNEKTLIITIVLNLIITISQIIGGLISGSVALLSDALHNFSDVVSLIISLVAEKLSKKEFTLDKTFGYKRAEILAALINTTTLIIIATILIYTAITNLIIKTPVVEAEYVIILAFVSILFNGISVLLLYKEAQTNLNIKSSYLHLLTDMLTSIGVLIGGILMFYFQLYWIDAILALLIGLYLLKESKNMIVEIFNVLMNFVPLNVSIEDIEHHIIKSDERILNIHHVHVWSLNAEDIYFQAHLDLSVDINLSEVDLIIEKINNDLKKNFKINHCIIQPEFNYGDSKKLIPQHNEH
jgi:cobalt-zinc-cadmium efflux system protein